MFKKFILVLSFKKKTNNSSMHFDCILKSIQSVKIKFFTSLKNLQIGFLKAF